MEEKHLTRPGVAINIIINWRTSNGLPRGNKSLKQNKRETLNGETMPLGVINYSETFCW